MKLKLFDTFAGIGATHKSLELIGHNVELVGYSEINRYADICYRSIYEADKSLNFGDIEHINPHDLPDFDIMNFSFPCKDFSVAGKMTGLKDKSGITHSGLYYHGMKIIKIKKPKYIIVENVKGITFKKFEDDFNEILLDFSNTGYNVYQRVLNAKDFSHPQNRERLIMVCIRKDIDTYKFNFPVKHDGNVTLKHIIEDKVDEKYFHDDISILKRSSKTSDLIVHKASIKVRVRKYDVDTDSLKKLLRSAKDNIKLTNKEISKLTNKPLTLVEHWFRSDKSFAIPSEDIWFELKYILKIDTELFDESIMTFEIREGTFDKTKRVYDVNGIAPTLTATTPNEKILLENDRIRDLTPLECWKIMGFSNEDFNKAKSGILTEEPKISISKLDYELYERAGRSIPINILKDVFKNLFT